MMDDHEILEMEEIVSSKDIVHIRCDMAAHVSQHESL